MVGAEIYVAGQRDDLLRDSSFFKVMETDLTVLFIHTDYHPRNSLVILSQSSATLLSNVLATSSVVFRNFPSIHQNEVYLPLK